MRIQDDLAHHILFVLSDSEYEGFDFGDYCPSGEFEEFPLSVNGVSAPMLLHISSANAERCVYDPTRH